MKKETAMQTYVQYRVCEGPLPSLKTLKNSSTDLNPSCFFVSARDHLAGHVNADDLLSFMETCGDTREKLQVLLFLSRHPRAKCTMDCLSCSPEAGRLDVRRAVRELTHQGVIVEWCEDGVALFALTSDPEKRNSVQNLGRLQWDQVRLWNEYRVVELTQEQVSS
ncbi:MAG: hypothetical protein HYY32_02885 [Chloroflexi bacterium]|nr:hypothetical protein [Chloroflexota bacterium]